MIYDVQAIRFIKTTTEKPVNENENAKYICLGHFDMMQISKLGEYAVSPLPAIKNDRISKEESAFGCTENNVYSLYILRHMPHKEIEDVEKFWELKTAFTVVTRIHCDCPEECKIGKSHFSSTLEYFCSQQNQPSANVVYEKTQEYKGNCVIQLSAYKNRQRKERARVNCIFYDSLELGDTVCILKANSVAAILEVIRCLSTNVCVRDTYTYCGIDREILQSSKFDVGDCIEKDSELAYISTRFSVRNLKKANAFLKEIQDNIGLCAPPFYVTGTADCLVQWGGLKEEELIKIMRFLTQDGQKLFSCFNDVITRIGIEHQSDAYYFSNNDQSSERSIEKAIPQYQETLSWLRKEHEASNDQNWRYTLLKLLGTLNSMYSNYVMDDLANLIIPSANAFLVRLNYLRKTDVKKLEEYDAHIALFLESWTRLTNDISQLESQLTQHPELMPVRYYIPAMILQFEMRFVEYCCIALSKEHSRKFVPLLQPIDDSNLSTICPLDPSMEEYYLACPLLVRVPIGDLYNPWQTAHIVAHEMAHYCEDDSRNRCLRHDKLIECISRYVVKYWYDEHLRPLPHVDQKKLYCKAEEYGRKLKQDFVERLAIDYPNSPWYLAESIDALAGLTFETVIAEDYLEQFLFYVNPNYFFENQQSYVHFVKEKQQTQKLLLFNEDVVDRLKLLQFLCTECYADLSMILLTNCSFHDYYMCVYHNEYQKYLEREKEPAVLFQNVYVMKQVVRMALVVAAIADNKGQKTAGIDSSWFAVEKQLFDGEQSSLVQCAFTIAKQSSERVEEPILSKYDNISPALLSYDDFVTLSVYLSTCVKDISNALYNQSSTRTTAAQKTQEGLRYVHDEKFDWGKIQQYITEEI